jgi:hypothetical protein
VGPDVYAHEGDEGIDIAKRALMEGRRPGARWTYARDRLASPEVASPSEISGFQQQRPIHLSDQPFAPLQQRVHVALEGPQAPQGVLQLSPRMTHSGAALKVPPEALLALGQGPPGPQVVTFAQQVAGQQLSILGIGPDPLPDACDASHELTRGSVRLTNYTVSASS